MPKSPEAEPQGPERGIISLAGLSKAEVLAALYNASKPQGMGFLQYDPEPMTRDEAQALLDRTTYFDYLKGRVMKVDLSGDELDPRLYDRDNGEGAATRAIKALRRTGNTNPVEVQATHHVSTLESAEDVKKILDEPSKIEERGDATVMKLGYGDVAEELGQAVDKAIKKRRE